ncbi:MAG: hypothetical protein ACYCZF_07795 [Anaerolineae bacterium]
MHPRLDDAGVAVLGIVVEKLRLASREVHAGQQAARKPEHGVAGGFPLGGDAGLSVLRSGELAIAQPVGEHGWDGVFIGFDVVREQLSAGAAQDSAGGADGGLHGGPPVYLLCYAY